MIWCYHIMQRSLPGDAGVVHDIIGRGAVAPFSTVEAGASFWLLCSTCLGAYYLLLSMAEN